MNNKQHPDLPPGIHFSEEFSIGDIDWDPTHFSDEFKQEFPYIWSRMFDKEKWYQKMLKNVEELQTRLNLKIEKDKQRLWSKDKLSNFSPLPILPCPFDEDDYSARRMMYSLFYDDPRCLEFIPWTNGIRYGVS